MKAPPEGTQRRTLRLSGRKANVLERGSGPVVVLVHGLGLSADLWEPHLERFADAGYRVIAPDIPGFGRSDGSLAGISVARAAEWLVDMADALEIDRAAWIGHSIGAQQLVRLAASSPDRTAALVLAGPTGRTGWHPIRQSAGLLATGFQERPRLVGSVLRRYLFSPVTTLTTWLRAEAHDMAMDAPLVECPVLLILGEEDAVVPGSFVALLQQLFRDSEVCTIEDASHAVAIDPTEHFTNTALAFLRRRYSRGVSTD